MSEYAVKVVRARKRPAWMTGLTLAEALEQAARLVSAEEAQPTPHYLTATIYLDAKVVSICRYFPPEMRKGEQADSPAPLREDS